MTCIADRPLERRTPDRRLRHDRLRYEAAARHRPAGRRQRPDPKTVTVNADPAEPRTGAVWHIDTTGRRHGHGAQRDHRQRHRQGDFKGSGNRQARGKKMERETGFEPATSTLARSHLPLSYSRPSVEVAITTPSTGDNFRRARTVGMPGPTLLTRMSRTAASSTSSCPGGIPSIVGLTSTSVRCRRAASGACQDRTPRVR